MRLNRATFRVAATTGVVAAGLTAGLAPQVAHAEPSAAADCRPAVFFTAGYKDGQTLDAFKGVQLPDSHQRIDVKYKDGVIPVVDDPALDGAVKGGVETELNAVRAFHGQCPDAKITLVGYSEGALVAGGTVEHLERTNEVPNHLVNAVLYGDPRRPKAPSGVAGMAGGVETNLPTFLGGMSMVGPHRFAGKIPVSEVCNENDGICNSPNIITNAQAVANGVQGYLQGDHGYRFDPLGEHAAPGDHFIPQPHRIAYGPPLPINVPTPQEMQAAGGNPNVDGIVKQVANGVNWDAVPQEAGFLRAIKVRADQIG